MKTSLFLATTALLGFWSQSVQGHGRMISPPHRGYMYRLPQFDFFPPNYDDDGLSAGGIGSTNTGLHGICGDPHSEALPRPHETGGKYGLFPKYGSKAIGACYKPGSVIDISVQITANHKGYFEFGLCKLNGKSDGETEQCFQSLAQPNGEKKWQLPRGAQTFTMQYQLPSGVTCDGDSHCVLRWWYVGWNNADVGINGQEQFWNCADIYISNNCGGITPPPVPSNKPTSAPGPGPDPNDDNDPVTPSPSRTKPPQPSTRPTTTSVSPSSKPSTSAAPAPPSGDCGSCNNCYYAPTNSCFSGWTEAQCASISAYKWCGGSKVSSSQNYGSDSVVKTNGQCGGRHYTGPTQCNSDALCVEIDEFYSECVLKSAL